MKRAFVLAVLLMVATSLAMAKGSESDGLLRGAGQIGVNSVDPGNDGGCHYEHSWTEEKEDEETFYTMRDMGVCIEVAAGGTLVIQGTALGLLVSGYGAPAALAAEAAATAYAALTGYHCSTMRTDPYLRHSEERILMYEREHRIWDEYDPYFAHACIRHYYDGDWEYIGWRKK